MFWDKFVSLCINKDVSPSAVCLELGFSKTMATNWKNGSQPRDTTMRKIADYFGVTVEYLIGSEKEQPIQSGSTSETVVLDHHNMRMVPLFETVSAGFGAYASDDIQDYMPVYFSNPSEADHTICIKVRGNSMSPKIEDGDIIQVHKQDAVDNGSVAVVLLEDEGLVKKVFYGTGWIELQSFNPTYATRRFEGVDASRIRVVGLVTQVIKGINGRKVNYVKMGDSKRELLDNIEKMDAEDLKAFNHLYNEYLKSKQG